ncbi:oligogalacturonate-specific porin KdgM family protein [Vibrio methylphosphonaticus]|uniref:oligogalacturonate-specific porin KdgM family protein n=1 Tax=Vibrio methylphosphonaticus TaxID=2946866 RepID=UPI00202A9D91|nr:oligogalacturonate-specific porin KdgM family protein [Vibrio methylphosphonaticus]MCL9776905.1 oligogalacturonate-specific porin KdgM family protein [Vibrio methylphosphonaticus]
MKTLKLTLAATLVAAVALPASATYVDVRGAYKTEAKTYETRVRAGFDFAEDWQIHLEGTQAQGDKLFSNSGKNVAAFETELNYNWAINDNVTLTPGFVYWNGSDHTEYRPYLKATYATGNFYTAARYRYQAATNSVSGQTTNDTNQVDAWIGYNVSDFNLEYNPAYINQKDGGAYTGTGNNKADTKWEHTFQVKYTGFESWAPYVDYQILDKTYANAQRTEFKTENRVRAGVTFNF